MHDRVAIVLLLALGVTGSAAAAPSAALDDELSANCVVEPNMVIELSSRVDGVLAAVTVQRGEPVTAGGVVAQLEDGVERADLARARARAAMEAAIRSNAASLEYGERTLHRVTELREKRVVSADEADCVRSEAEIARHRLEASREEKRLAELELRRAHEVLKRQTIVSPIDGVVAERYLNPGESVEDKPILRIAQIDPLRVELVMPGTDFGLIRPGDRARVRLDDAAQTEHAARVIIVDPLIDAASGTFRVTLELPNPEHRLTSGLRCGVTFLDTDPAVATAVERADELPALPERSGARAN